MGFDPQLFVHVVKELDESLTEQADINRKKNDIDDRVEALMDAVRALHKVYGGELPPSVAKQVDGDMGITDQVREVLKAQVPNPTPANFAGGWLQPMQVRQILEQQRGFDLSGYSNAMAVIHQVLKRLEKQKEIEIHPNGQTYRWRWK
jgi:hypothetical protein